MFETTNSVPEVKVQVPDTVPARLLPCGPAAGKNRFSLPGTRFYQMIFEKGDRQERNVADRFHVVDINSKTADVVGIHRIVFCLEMK